MHGLAVTGVSAAAWGEVQSAPVCADWVSLVCIVSSAFLLRHPNPFHGTKRLSIRRHAAHASIYSGCQVTVATFNSVVHAPQK